MGYGNKKYRQQVQKDADAIDQNMKQFPKPLQIVGKIGSVLGSVFNPMEAEENAMRLSNSVRRQWPRKR